MQNTNFLNKAKGDLDKCLDKMYQLSCIGIRTKKHNRRKHNHSQWLKWNKKAIKKYKVLEVMRKDL